MKQLVLSLFPGIDLLGSAFEQEGFCVVRGPDVLWGGDIRRFDPPAGKFDGVIGGPPCQCFSQLRHLNPLAGKGKPNLIPEFVRCVESARPRWFVMENVVQAQEPGPGGYLVHSYDLRDADLGGYTQRRRRFWFGSALGWTLAPEGWPEILTPARAVTTNVRIPSRKHQERAKQRGGGVLPGDGRYETIEAICKLQGLPGSFHVDGPFKRAALRVMLGNGVPMAMGRAIAKAVKRAVEANYSAVPVAAGGAA